ncbi:MAG: NlpC/P60 family protein [Candidatus Sulfotelmatobacter sp.]
MRTNRQRYRLSALALVAILCVPVVFAKNSTQVIVVPVANMYSHPSDQSDVVSQAIYGSNVTLLIARGEWCRIQTADHYKGWVPSRHLRLVQIGTGYATTGPTIRVESLFANIYREPDVTRHKPVITVPFETLLELIPDETSPDEQRTTDKKAAENSQANKTDAKPTGMKTSGSKETGPRKTATKTAATNRHHDGWLQVRLPGKTVAWIQSSDVVADPKPLSIPESIELAKRFLGLPYLWGGTSSFGFDCSGFTQMLLRARGFNMPRDADQQAAWKGLIVVERTDLQPGDLLFFGPSQRNITHTGMFIGDGQFIQAATNGHPVIQISHLDDQPWTRLLVASRRTK